MDGSTVRVSRGDPLNQATGQSASADRSDAASSGTGSEFSLTDVAVYDLDGTGELNTRPAVDGGDATLLLPSHAIDLPTWPHEASASIPFTTTHVRFRANQQPQPVLRHVRDAYTRDGAGVL